MNENFKYGDMVFSHKFREGIFLGREIVKTPEMINLEVFALVRFFHGDELIDIRRELLIKINPQASDSSAPVKSNNV